MVQMKKGYWVVTYRSVSDTNRLQEYAKVAGPAIQSAGGKTLVRTSEVSEVHESGLAQRVVVIEFENVDKARAAFNSEAYGKAREILKGAVERDVRIVEGVE